MCNWEHGCPEQNGRGAQRDDEHPRRPRILKAGVAMTHLTIETVECPGCGHSHTIEVDTEKAMKEAKEAFNRKHKDCKKNQ